jgi:two-component system chemotaxis response regulator CheY
VKILIAEDDLASRKFLQKVLTRYGDCDLVVDGEEAIEAFMMAWDEGQPYDLICLDIMMPNVDGLKALKIIRDIETEKKLQNQNRAKIIVITALDRAEKVVSAFNTGCEAYAVKPIDTEKLHQVMEKLGLKIDN